MKLLPRAVTSLGAAVVLLGATLSMRLPAAAISTIDATCNPTVAQHYRNKGIAFTNSRQYRNAALAFAASVQSINCCPAGTVNLVWAYYALMFEAAANLGYGSYDGAEEAIGWARDMKARLSLMNLSAADRTAVKLNDENIERIEHGIIAGRATQLSAQQLRRYMPSASASYRGGVAPDCDDETIDEVKEDGKVIVTLTGAVFLVSDIDSSTSSIWLSSDDLQACTGDGRHYRLIDGSDNVFATKIK